MQPDPLDREQAEQLAQELLALDGVAGLDGGRFGEVALLYPGARIRGLHVSTPTGDNEKPHLEVYVVAAASGQPNLKELAERVRQTAAPYTTLPVDVVIADVA